MTHFLIQVSSIALLPFWDVFNPLDFHPFQALQLLDQAALVCHKPLLYPRLGPRLKIKRADRGCLFSLQHLWPSTSYYSPHFISTSSSTSTFASDERTTNVFCLIQSMNETEWKSMAWVEVSFGWFVRVFYYLSRQHYSTLVLLLARDLRHRPNRHPHQSRNQTHDTRTLSLFNHFFTLVFIYSSRSWYSWINTCNALLFPAPPFLPLLTSITMKQSLAVLSHIEYSNYRN